MEGRILTTTEVVNRKIEALDTKTEKAFAEVVLHIDELQDKIEAFASELIPALSKQFTKELQSLKDQITANRNQRLRS